MAILELAAAEGICTCDGEALPESRIVAVSNSASQRKYITAKAAERNLTNLEVITADMNDSARTRS